MLKKILLLTVVIGCLYSCGSNEPKVVFKSIEKQLQTQFIAIQDSGVIDLPEGHFLFKGSLSLEGKKNITIKGKGKDKTFLSFKGQTEGSEGLKITNCEHVTMTDFTVQDAKGDAIKMQDVKGLTCINLIVEWTGEARKENGSYGLYPVNCDSVLLDNCVSIGASDAGIYVGQSRQVVVRNCNPTHNVAGIEIENCQYAEVYDNHPIENTGGILVFDMPGLKQHGHDVRVYHNTVEKNNFKNFAPEGNIVGVVPPGTGIMVLATKNVEIFDNNVVGNKTLGTCIASYMLSGFHYNDTLFDPYPKGINIHNNTYNRGFRMPTLSNKFGKLMALKFWLFWHPDVVYDGLLDPKAVGSDGKYPDGLKVCVKNNGNAKLCNVDAGNDFKNFSTDAAQFDCDKPTLKPNTFNPK